jgi:hypothetical protein
VCLHEFAVLIQIDNVQNIEKTVRGETLIPQVLGGTSNKGIWAPESKLKARPIEWDWIMDKPCDCWNDIK